MKRKNINMEFASKGINIPEMNKEFKDTTNLYKQAEKRVLKRRGVIGRISYFLKSTELGYHDPMMVKEFERLQKGL